MAQLPSPEDIRYRLEERWKKLGYDRLLGEERDYILTWWLEAEASNGTLHQYFANSTGDSAVAAHAALRRIGATNAAGVFLEAISLFGVEYPADRATRNNSLTSMATADDGGDSLLERLTDRLFSESEDVQSLALNRVGDAYTRNGISEDPTNHWPARRIIGSAILACIAISVVGLLVILALVGE